MTALASLAVIVLVVLMGCLDALGWLQAVAALWVVAAVAVFL